MMAGLGCHGFRKTTLSDVPFPVELHLPGVRIVSLATSETSVHIPISTLNQHPHILLSLYTDRAFHALGDDGSVYVWGGCL
jgi:hypothetical protein